MKDTIWYMGTSGGIYMQEELKLAWYEENPNERFEPCIFYAWLDEKGFERIN